MEKVSFALIAVILFVMSFTSCSNDTNSNAANIPEIYSRNISFGMSEDDVVAQESDLTFNTDFSRTGVNEEHSVKCIVSNETVYINSNEATVSYIFSDNMLTQIEYNMPVIYDKEKIFDTPATQVYNKQVTDLTNAIGLPTETNSEDLSTINSQISIWNNSTIYIAIYAIQTTEVISDGEITDNVCITMTCSK